MKLRRSALLLLLIACRRDQSDRIEARGTIEVPEIDLAAMVSARVVSIRVDEGANLRPGDTVAILIQSDLRSAIAAQQARVAMAVANLRDLEAGARPQEIRRAEAEVAMAQAEAERTAKDYERAKALYERDAIARQQLDYAATAATTAADRRRALEEALALLRAGSREDRIGMARSEVVTARASLGMLEARQGDLVLVSPVAGRLLRRLAEPGEVLAPNAPAVTIGELGRAYARVYVPAAQLARLRVGDSATVRLEGSATTARGRIAAVNPQAEFTPRVALTERERADLMFGVKVDLIDPPPGFHPGLWAAVEFHPAGVPR